MIGFESFFRELHGVPAHSWQRRLAERLAAGEPPRAIVVPTGGGKTAALDALVWALARQVDRPSHERTVGVRIVWAIDRRLLVDEVFERMGAVAERLASAAVDADDPLHSAAAALGAYTDGDGPPLDVVRWRGQVRIESRSHHPLQPQIITSTVAQVGSRMLFRGFGVGERSLALEAALAAVDSTVCLDEAHLSEPFRQTVDAITAMRARREPAALLPGLRLMTLSATPAAAEDLAAVHATTDADDVSLGRRLDARKRLALVDASPTNEHEQVAGLVEAVTAHLEHAERIACVVNTVRLAGLVAARVRAERPAVDCVALVGPQRPHDRRHVLDAHRGAIFDREHPARPLVVVATQTVEVGLDADFEALVTQSASATAIVQRLGRLNRAGLDEGSATVVRAPAIGLYERDEPACWAWLQDLRGEDGTVDASPRALSASGGPPRDGRTAFAPVLTEETVDLLQQTAPRPAPTADPAVEVFLRGVEEPPGDDVQICWRSDLRLDDDSDAGASYRQALLRLAPPQAGELVTIGLRRFHALVQARFGHGPAASRMARAADAEADVEGGSEAAMTVAAEGAALPRFVVVRDGDVIEVPGAARVRDVRPGDTIVLAATLGGYAGDVLDPASSTDVEDIGNAVALSAATGTEPVGLRLTPELVGEDVLRLARRVVRSGEAPTPEQIAGLVGNDAPALAAEVVAVAAGAEAYLDEDPWEDEEELGSGLLFEDERDAGLGDRFVLVLGARLRPDLVRGSAEPPPTLDAHSRAVAERAQRFAAHLDPALARGLNAAGCAHDLGKADERIQAFYRGGTRSVGDDPLAKSVFGTDDRAAARAAQRRSGLPRGLRHEIASVAVLASHLGERRPAEGWCFDEALALHVVGSHHGLGRPWPRMPGPGAPALDFFAEAAGVRGVARGDGLDGWAQGAWLDRFFDVTGRYGAWGTAYLEALLMLADRTVSAEGG